MRKIEQSAALFLCVAMMFSPLTTFATEDYIPDFTIFLEEVDDMGNVGPTMVVALGVCCFFGLPSLLQDI